MADYKHNQEEQKDTEEKKNDNEKTEEEKLKELIDQMKDLEEKSEKKGRKKPVLMLEFGGIFHRHPMLNYLMYYMVNLVVIYSIVTLFGFGEFSSQIWVPLLFVMIYTASEIVFRQYIMLKHFKIALKSLGFIFFFGYLTLFYLIDIYLFPNTLSFHNETLLIMFAGMFVVFRYLLTYLIKYVIFRQRGL